MSWLDKLLDRAPEAEQAPLVPIAAPGLHEHPEAVAPRQETAPAAPQAMGQVMSHWVPTRARSGPDDMGSCIAAFYSVADGVLTMHAEDGKPTGVTHQLAAGDSERGIAGRLALRAYARTEAGQDFNRPLRYQPLGIA